MSASNTETQIIIDLNKILHFNDASEVKRMKAEFESNGWCFVLLPTELIPDPKLINELLTFFQAENGKSRYAQLSTTPAVYGYSEVNHKEGIKLLTGIYLSQFATKGLVPKMLIEPLNYLCQVLDAATKRLVTTLDEHLVFQQTPSLPALIELADLPWQDEHFGMLDIVSYFNNKNGFQAPEHGQTTEEVNCVAHYDPGLLSISILSNLQGLQLKNMTTNEWIDGPVTSHIGVIWLGEAASRITQNRLKPGIHRVIYPQEAKRRLTIWYELCTTGQLRNISVDQQKEMMVAGSVTFDNVPDLAEMTVLPGESKLEFLKRVEGSSGLSFSKTLPPVYKLQKHNISYPPADSKKKRQPGEQSRNHVIQKFFTLCL